MLRLFLLLLFWGAVGSGEKVDRKPELTCLHTEPPNFPCSAQCAGRGRPSVLTFGSSATWQPPESYGRLLCWEATEAQIQAADLINKHRGHVRWRRNTEETQPGARCRFPPSSSSVLSVWQPTLVPTALLRNLSGQFTPPKQTHIQTTPRTSFMITKKKDHYLAWLDPNTAKEDRTAK